MSPWMKVAAFGVSSEALRAVVTTVAPPSSSRCTMAAPIPREPPVTTTRFPANSVASGEVSVLYIRSNIARAEVFGGLIVTMHRGLEACVVGLWLGAG